VRRLTEAMAAFSIGSGEDPQPRDTPEDVPPTPPDEPKPAPVEDPPAEPVTPPYVVIAGGRARKG
jgi:hypothetical protein